jgi:hypothetical protein
MDRFAILVDGKIPYHSPKSYGDKQAEGEAPMGIDHYLKRHKRSDADALRALKPGETSTRKGAAKITRVGGDACRMIAVTFDTVSEESGEHGDTDRRGWKDAILITRDDLDLDENDQPDTSAQGWIDAGIRAMRDEHCGSLEADSSSGVPRWLGETDAALDEERRDFHFEDYGWTDEEILGIARGLRVYGYTTPRAMIRDGSARLVHNESEES